MRNNNWFIDEVAQESGEFELCGSKVRLKLDLRVGSWVLLSPGVGCFRVMDKKKSGAAYIYTLEHADEIAHAWRGTVYEMRLPLNFVRMAQRVLAWANSDEAKPSAVAGETVAGVYTWRRANTANGLPLGWQELFAKEMDSYRRYVTGVRP